MTQAYTSKLSLRVRRTDVGAQKIDGSIFKIFGMVLASFQVGDKLGMARVFQETFLLADTNMEVVLEMPFLTLRNANIQFDKKKLTWRSYIAVEAMPTTKRIELIDKKEFTKAALDENVEDLVMHVTSLSLSLMSIYLAREARIASLLAEEVKIPTKYSDFSDIFSDEKTSVLLDRIEPTRY